MKKYFKFFKMEFKKDIKMYPKMLFIAILLFSIVCGISFIGVKYIEPNAATFKINIAVVQEESSNATSLALDYITNIKTLSENCTFHIVEKEEGFKMLEESKVSALIYLPAQVISGIISGENIPAKIYFPKNAGIESSMLKEYTNSGINMLQVAQAQIYGIYDTAKEFGQKNNLVKFELDVNTYNLMFALNRLVLFVENEVSSTNELNVLEYYTISAIVLFLLFFGIALYPIMKEYNTAFKNQLKKINIDNTIITLNKGIISYFMYLVTFLIIYTGASFIFNGSIDIPSLNSDFLISTIISLFFIVSFMQLIYNLTINGSSSVLFIFILNIIMSYISGIIIPVAYLPNILQTISRILPTTYLHRLMSTMYTGEININAMVILLIYSLVFILINVIYEKRESNV